MIVKILKPLAVVMGLLSLATFLTYSHFVDRASSEGNEFSAGVWATPTPTGGCTTSLINGASVIGGSALVSPSPSPSDSPSPAVSPTESPTTTFSPSESLLPTETPSPGLTE